MVRKIQKAGRYSTQVNAGRDVIIESSSFDKDSIRSIVKSEIEQTLSNYKADALDKAFAKGNAMIDKLIKAVGDDHNKLASFSEPDFNYALRDATRAIASNDATYTEEMLVDILVHRATFSGSSKVKIVTKKAIEAADKLSDNTLNGLTFFWILLYITPAENNFKAMLSNISKTYSGALRALSAQTAPNWVIEAELLGLIELERGFGSDETKSFTDLVAERHSRYLRYGIERDRWVTIRKTLEEHHLEIRDCIIEHPLKEGFVLIDYDTEEQFISAVNNKKIDTEPVQSLINQLIRTNNFGSIDSTAMMYLETLIIEHDELKEINEWWQALPACRITMIGKAISFLHAKNYIKFIGPSTLIDFLEL